MANWNKILSRGNVEDRRSFAPVAGTLSLGVVVVIVAANYLLGGNLLTALQDIAAYQQQTGQVQQATTTIDDGFSDFASAVVGSGNDIWSKKFNELNKTYQEPRLVLFRDATNSGCGIADSRVGPHYCPEDNTIYLDETFFRVLTDKLQAQGGDVAEAYVIAHEMGHHVQNLMGVFEKNQSVTESLRQKVSIETELQADCYAGIWANSLKDKAVFEPNEIIEAMDAAKAVGDDRIQQTLEGRINPENWTHGSSKDRLAWFTKGYETGSVAECDTFR